MPRHHWSNCITHADDDVNDFIEAYFVEPNRRCLLVAAAGFDPRSKIIAEMLAKTLGPRLAALFIREERRSPDAALIGQADRNEKDLRLLVPSCTVEHVQIFGDDGAEVGGTRVAALLSELSIDDGVTDVVLDMSALSIGIGFPAAKLLLAECENFPGRAFHILIVSNPDLDDGIASEPAERAMPVKGFSGAGRLVHSLEKATMWMPQLSRGRNAALAKINASVGDCYKICPVLPFPAADPRKADALIGEYQNELANDWEVDPRDIVYVSEHNPLDSYRTISTLKERYHRTVEGTYAPEIILSPIGSKVMAVGALMAAIEHDLAVHYVETARYEFSNTYGPQKEEQERGTYLLHILLSGPACGEFITVKNSGTK